MSCKMKSLPAHFPPFRLHTSFLSLEHKFDMGGPGSGGLRPGGYGSDELRALMVSQSTGGSQTSSSKRAPLLQSQRCKSYRARRSPDSINRDKALREARRVSAPRKAHVNRHRRPASWKKWNRQAAGVVRFLHDSLPLWLSGSVSEVGERFVIVQVGKKKTKAVKTGLTAQVRRGPAPKIRPLMALPKAHLWVE